MRDADASRTHRHGLLLTRRSSLRRYHHRKSEDFSAEDGPQGHTLERANGHLNKALEIQSQQLGALHISTLCSHLVKAQVRGYDEATRPSNACHPSQSSHAPHLPYVCRCS